jgi:hypothetical protein
VTGLGDNPNRYVPVLLDILTGSDRLLSII